jgi:hypothetical protein
VRQRLEIERRLYGTVGGQGLRGDAAMTGKVALRGACFVGTIAARRSPINRDRQGRAMSKILDEVLAANAKYAEGFGEKANLPLPPS